MAEVLSSPAPEGRKTRLDRLLSLAADVRAGEGAGALLLALNVFSLLAFYYVLKTVRESLILSEGGACRQTAARIHGLQGEVPTPRDSENPFALFNLVEENVDAIRSIRRGQLRFFSLLLCDLVRPCLPIMARVSCESSSA